MRTTLYWIPRIAAIAFGLFLSLFALDSFEGTAPARERLAHFAVHLVPTAVYAMVVILAWRWEWAGAVLFAALGAGYAAMAGRERLDWSLAITGPLFLLSALFLAGWFNHPGQRNQPPAFSNGGPMR